MKAAGTPGSIAIQFTEFLSRKSCNLIIKCIDGPVGPAESGRVMPALLGAQVSVFTRILKQMVKQMIDLSQVSESVWFWM
jgi:hypothetical protein